MIPYILKKPFFWIATGIFILVVFGATVYLFPPLFSKYGVLKEEKQSLKAELDKQRKYAQIIKELTKNKEAVSALYDAADQAMPASVNADFLLLQLEGLSNELGIASPTLVVPFSQATTPAASTAAPAASGEVKKGTTATSTQPVVKNDAAGTQVTFSIGGELDFAKTKTLIERLRSLSRWNKITSIDLTRAGDKSTTTIVAQIFTSTTKSATFTGSDSNFLTKANALFGATKAYTTEPNINTEGNYGRSNPFDPVK